jgi:hypothetical protein
MTIQTNDLVTRQDIINKFNERIKAWVGTHVNTFASTRFTATHRVWNGRTPVGNGAQSSDPASWPIGSHEWYFYTTQTTLDTTAGYIAATSPWYDGETVSTLTDDPVPSEVITQDMLSADIGGGQYQAGHVIKVMKDFLKVYSKIHMVAFQNIHNLSPHYITGVAKGTTIPSVIHGQIDSDIDNLALTKKLKSGTELDASEFLDFIDSCRTIWYNRCIGGGVLETFKFSYCHSSCHSNVTCYNSRGRR